jgi:hypothetical protein
VSVTRGRGGLFVAAALAFCGCDRAGEPDPARAPPRRSSAASAPVRAPSGWLKGQLHSHTGRSPDSRTDPAEVAAWYAARAYDFLVITDHGVVTEVEAPPGLLVLRGVELTQNLRSCEPPPARGDACLLHVNALFVRSTAALLDFDGPPGATRLDLYARAVERGLALGGLVQLNHPNFHHAADAPLVVSLARRGVGLVEIENRAVDSGNEGDATHPSTEALWDAALAAGARVFGTATDDAHHYGDADRVRARGGTAYTGDRGFVMVRAERSEASIRDAIERGDFYGTTGLVLRRVDVTDVALELATDGATATFELIGDGHVVATARGATARFAREGRAERGLRVRARDDAGRVAFTQPVWR